MKGRGEIITILCISVFLICILYVLTYGGIVKAEELEEQPEETPKKTAEEVEEELRWEKEVKKILSDIGVGVKEKSDEEQEAKRNRKETARYQMARAGETINTKVLEKNIGAIDVIDYNDPSWPTLEHWNEGKLGSSSGEVLYCTNPKVDFLAGSKKAVDASRYYNEQTIQMIAAMFYYYDKNKCGGLSENYDYLLKQCAVWWVLNEVHHWYGDNVQIETGNGVACGQGHWISAHKSEYYRSGILWAKENYKYFPDAYGIIYEGNGQPLSKWGGTYQPTGTARLKKNSSNSDVTDQNNCYSLKNAEFGIYSSSSLEESSRAGTFLTDASGNTSSVTLTPGTYYIKELKAPKGYALTDEVKTVVVKPGQESIVTFSDTPQMNPIELLLQKTGEDKDDADLEGEAAYQGAQFLIKFYAEILEGEDNPEDVGKAPVRSWVFETDDQGVCRYQEE